MADQIPSLQTIRERMKDMGHAEVQALAKKSGVPFTTLWKIKVGPTANPGVETVRKFWPLLPERRKGAR
jgi:predicted transcriptional regulator